MEKTPLVKKPSRFAGYQSPTPGHHTRDKKARRHALTMSNVRPVQIPCWLVRTEGQLQLGRGEPPLLWPRGLWWVQLAHPALEDDGRVVEAGRQLQGRSSWTQDLEAADWSCPLPQWGLHGSRYCSKSSRSSSLWRWCSPGQLRIFLNVSTARLRLIRWSLASSRNNVYSS